MLLNTVNASPTHACGDLQHGWNRGFPHRCSEAWKTEEKQLGGIWGRVLEKTCGQILERNNEFKMTTNQLVICTTYSVYVFERRLINIISLYWFQPLTDGKESCPLCSSGCLIGCGGFWRQKKRRAAVHNHYYSSDRSADRWPHSSGNM